MRATEVAGSVEEDEARERGDGRLNGCGCRKAGEIGPEQEFGVGLSVGHNVIL